MNRRSFDRTRNACSRSPIELKHFPNSLKRQFRALCALHCSFALSRYTIYIVYMYMYVFTYTYIYTRPAAGWISEGSYCSRIFWYSLNAKWGTERAEKQLFSDFFSISISLRIESSDWEKFPLTPSESWHASEYTIHSDNLILHSIAFDVSVLMTGVR